MKLKRIDISTIRSWEPCYDPSRHLPEDFSGDVITLLDNKEIPFRDRLWCALRASLVSEKLMRLYAVKAAGTVEHLMKDERSKTALRVTEAFIEGKATRDELLVARRGAWSAADAADDAAADAADDADAAAAYAAYAAAYADAAYAAYAAAADAAYAAAADFSSKRTQYQEQQIALLRDLITKGIETGDSVLEKE